MTADVSVMGASACQKQFETLAFNLAAANAVGGKGQDSFATAFNTHGRQGIEVNTIRQMSQVGTAVNSTVSSHISIEGQGMIPVRNQPNASGDFGLCRDGTFHRDANDNFVNNIGQYLQVFLTNSDGTPKNPDVSTTDALTTLNTQSINLSAEATNSVDFSILLKGDAAVGETHPMVVQARDSFGNMHNLTGTWTKTNQTPVSTGGTQVWTLQFNDSTGAGTIAAPYSTGISVEFDGAGKPSGYVQNGTSSATPPALGITWNNGAKPSAIQLNLGTVGQTDGVVIGNRFNNNKIQPNGYAAGDFSNIEFTKDGYGLVNFTNGQQTKYCRIPLAKFNNVNGLRESEPGVFQQTASSGVMNLSFPGEGGTGFLIPKAYEGSTVNATQVYLDMLDVQRVYMGDLKTITIGKEMDDQLMSI